MVLFIDYHVQQIVSLKPVISRQSVSDDSVDLGASHKQSGAKSSQKSAQKSTVSWYQDDEYSDGGTGRGNNEERFLYDITSIPLDCFQTFESANATQWTDPEFENVTWKRVFQLLSSCVFHRWQVFSMSPDIIVCFYLAPLHS